MAAIIRTQFIDEMINMSGNLQWLYENSGLNDEQEFVQSIGLKYDQAFWKYTRKNVLFSKKVLENLKKVYKADEDALFNENKHSHAFVCDDPYVLLHYVENKEKLELTDGDKLFHIDPRMARPSYAVVLKNDDYRIDVYKDFKDVTFVLELSIGNFGRNYVNGELHYLTNKKYIDFEYYWCMTGKNEDVSVTDRWILSKNIDLSETVTKHNSRTISPIKAKYTRIGVVRYAIINLKYGEKNIRDIYIINRKPKYYSYKDCFRCNVAAILKKRQEAQYTAFAHELGISETKFRKYLFEKIPVDEDLLKRIEEKCGITPDVLLHDSNKEFIDIFNPDRFKEGYLSKRISKIDRISSLPIDKSMIDSEYCFAMENNNENIKEFTFEGSSITSNFVVDTRYSVYPLQENVVSLECLLNAIDDKLEFKWTIKKEDFIYIADDKNITKNVKTVRSVLFDKQYERIGSVSYCFNYHGVKLHEHTTGVKIKK